MSTVFPTTQENVTERLFLRFFLMYVAAFAVSLFFTSHGVPLFCPENMAALQFAVIPLAFLGGITNVCAVYLSLLTLFKAIPDAALLFRVTRFVRTDGVGIWQWNACFFLLTLSVFLFSFSASKACLFSFHASERNLRLIFSKLFGRYLLELLISTALSVLLYFLFSRLGDLLPA